MKRNLAALSGASALQAAANAVAGLLATRALGPHERGLMVLGLTIGSVYGLVGGLGTGAAFRSRLPAARSAHARRNLAAAFTWCSIGGLALVVCLAVATGAVSARWIDPALGSSGILLATACFTAGQHLLTQVPDAWFADGRFRRGGLSAAVISAGGLAGVAAVLTVTHSASALLLAQALGMTLVGAAEVRGLRQTGLVVLTRPQGAEIRSLLRQGTPAVGLTVGLVVALRADRYLLGVAAGAAAVGVYSLAATLSEVSRLLPAAAGQLYLRETSTGQGRKRFRPAVTFAVAAAAVGGIAVLALAWVLIVPVFGPGFAAARPLLAVLVVAEVCLAPYSVASRGLLGGGWTAAAGVLGACGSVLAVTVYALSAGAAGAAGVAFGSVLVYAGLSLAAGDLLRRRVYARKEALG